MQNQTSNNTKTPNFTAKGLLLYFLPSPLFIALLFSITNIVRFTAITIILILLYSAARLNRKTQKQLAINKNRAHHEPIKDYRKQAMLLLGAAIFILFFILIKPNIIFAGIFAALAMFGFYLSYGLGTPPEQIIEQIQLDAMPKATREAIDEAYKDLAKIELLIKNIDVSDKTLKNLVGEVVEQSYKIMNLIVKNAENAGQARKFLNVYINRIKEILSQYLDLAKHGKSAEFRDKLLDTLNEVNKAFAQQESKLLNEDIFKLDIQLEVLKEQIEKEQ